MFGVFEYGDVLPSSVDSSSRVELDKEGSVVSNSIVLVDSEIIKNGEIFSSKTTTALIKRICSLEYVIVITFRLYER